MNSRLLNKLSDTVALIVIVYIGVAIWAITPA